MICVDDGIRGVCKYWVVISIIGILKALKYLVMGLTFSI
jgi:hypothetical protein